LRLHPAGELGLPSFGQPREGVLDFRNRTHADKLEEAAVRASLECPILPGRWGERPREPFLMNHFRGSSEPRPTRVGHHPSPEHHSPPVLRQISRRPAVGGPPRRGASDEGWGMDHPSSRLSRFTVRFTAQPATVSPQPSTRSSPSAWREVWAGTQPSPARARSGISRFVRPGWHELLAPPLPEG
jgi:hypothetical protein